MRDFTNAATRRRPRKLTQAVSSNDGNRHRVARPTETRRQTGGKKNADGKAEGHASAPDVDRARV